MDEDDAAWLTVSSSDLGDATAFEGLRPELLERLQRSNPYRLSYPANTTSKGQLAELKILATAGFAYHYVENDHWGRWEYALNPAQAVALLRHLWMADDFPPTDALDDEGTAYGLLSALLSTLDIELI